MPSVQRGSSCLGACALGLALCPTTSQAAFCRRHLEVRPRSGTMLFVPVALFASPRRT
ncbi:MAG: hypothetical protein ACLT98_14170 [Eggerthellaceae bacterium]